MAVFYKTGGDFDMPYLNNEEKIYIGKFEDKSVREHEHDFLELVYVLRGSARHFMNGEEIIIKKGDYLIIDYNTAHRYEQVGSEVFSIVNCLFYPGFIDRTLRECRKFSEVLDNYLIHYSYRSINANPVNRIFSDDDGSVGHNIMKMYSEYGGKQAGYIEILRCLLIETIIFTMRKLREEDRLVYNNIENYIAGYVNENYMNKITLTELSKKLAYSLPYLSRTFRQSSGMTFESFLQKTRIEQSCRLLANTDKKIIDIAECVGYTDLKFFSKTFKKFMNMSPREYRRLCR